MNAHAIDSRRPIEKLLPLLTHVRRAGPNSWRAWCPNPCHEHGAHGALAITEASDGTILLRCHSCNDTPGIIGALGLQMADLFDHPIRDASPEARTRARAEMRWAGERATVSVADHETTVVLAAAGVMRHHEALPPDFDERLSLAAQRIERAKEFFHARP